jgi:hypothetical protein
MDPSSSSNNTTSLAQTALNSVKIQLDKYDGDKKNFGAWSWLFRAYLQKYNLHGVISDDEIDVDLMDAEENRAVFLLIATHVTPKVAKKLSTADVPDGDGRTAWKKLVTEFGDVRAMERYAFLFELLFSLLKQVDGEKLDEFIARKKELGEKLKAKPLTVDELMIIGTMRGLPATLSNAADVALFREDLTFDEFSSLLKSKMEQIALRRKDTETSTALFVKDHRKGYGKFGNSYQQKGNGKNQYQQKGNVKGKGKGKNQHQQKGKGKGKANTAKAFISFSEALTAATEDED